jgi:hypothetical protein
MVWHFSESRRADLLELFKEAEKKKYSEKLLHSQSAGNVVDVLTKHLKREIILRKDMRPVSRDCRKNGKRNRDA